MSQPRADLPNLTVLEHPLILHKLSHLRHRGTGKKLFKELVDEIAALMTYEVTRDLEVEDVEVETPLERMTGKRIRGRKLVVCGGHTHCRGLGQQAVEDMAGIGERTRPAQNHI